MAKLLTATEAYLAGRVDVRAAFRQFERIAPCFATQDSAEYEAVNQAICDRWQERVNRGELPDPTEEFIDEQKIARTS